MADTLDPNLEAVSPVNIEDQMQTAYLDYAMSVIVSRALPDVRDGLKPVQRRILHSMQELNARPGTAYKKSARIVGDTMGRYHPHSNEPIYDAMVRMAQTFSMRNPLIDGQGNYGSVDGDPPAAMRYTEARLHPLAMEVLADIEKETVDFAPNFDGSLNEPTVLPSKVPNLLINGAAGIAVGMATSIPPHNLSEVVDALTFLADKMAANQDDDVGVEDLMQFIQGPDFPTAGTIVGTEGIREAYATGRGRVIVRARARIEEMRGNRFRIVVTELPYQVNKAAMLERMAQLVRDKKLEGISELRDESDRSGMRVVIELRRDAFPQQVLNHLYQHTAMQSSFYCNMLALVDQQPRVLSLKSLLREYIRFRQEVVTRRTQYELERARERAHILMGLIIALDNLDEVIATIRKSRNAQTARNNLQRNFGLSEKQANAVLSMELRRLAAMERKAILDEYEEIKQTITRLETILGDIGEVYKIIKQELAALKDKFGDDRRTVIAEDADASFSQEDLVPKEDVLITLTERGYIKRQPAGEFQAQRRGGKGIIGIATRASDAVQTIMLVDSHDWMLIVSDRGRAFTLRAYEIPEGTRTSRGQNMVNLLQGITRNERITAIVPVPSFQEAEGAFITMVSVKGQIKRTSLSAFANARTNGVIAMNLADDDSLYSAILTNGKQEVILFTAQGLSIRFPEANITAHSRTAGGVNGISLQEGDQLVGMALVEPDSRALLITEHGFGKQVEIEEFRVQSRGGKGIIALKVDEKSGPVVGGRIVTPEDDEICIITRNGQITRVPLTEIKRLGRPARGVIAMRMRAEEDTVAGVTLIPKPGNRQRALFS
jgi:DNA gyrase subunit A